jgi:CheY-like chemotaxis protein
MNREVIILVAEDDDGHFDLIKRNLERSGIKNQIIRFKDGEEILNFLFKISPSLPDDEKNSYIILLDIRMPKYNGAEVLEKIKTDENLKKIPVTMITTTDDPKEIEKCHLLGCNNYITKPVDYDKFVDTIRQLGLFLLVIEVP